jgi:hypothetical protein
VGRCAPADWGREGREDDIRGRAAGGRGVWARKEGHGG